MSTAGCESVGFRAYHETTRGPGGLCHLRLHVFGHIHEGYGGLKSNGCQFVNASICTVDYEPINEPVVVDV